MDGHLRALTTVTGHDRSDPLRPPSRPNQYRALPVRRGRCPCRPFIIKHRGASARPDALFYVAARAAPTIITGHQLRRGIFHYVSRRPCPICLASATYCNIPSLTIMGRPQKSVTLPTLRAPAEFRRGSLLFRAQIPASEEITKDGQKSHEAIQCRKCVMPARSASDLVNYEEGSLTRSNGY